MEPIGSILEEEWSSLSGMYTGDQEADLMAQLLGSCHQSTHQVVHSVSTLGIPSSFWAGNETPMNLQAGASQGSFYSLDIGNGSLFRFSQESDGGGVLFPDSSQESYYLGDAHPISVDNNSCNSLDYCIGDGRNSVSYLVEGDHDCSNREGSKANVEKSGRKVPEASPPDNSLELQLKKEAETPAPEPPEEEKTHYLSENSQKRSRTSEDASKDKRSARPKRSKKLVQAANNAEETNAGLNAPASSSYCSEDESNASQELNGGASSSLSSKGTSALNSSGKTRASRGAATDPQSLYARKRRERINERLKILQNLVPNGTKVDISTMLEEAVQYVKFLQLQIKLLSSDELWMYAPIAYNGMNIGLDLKVPTPRS